MLALWHVNKVFLALSVTFLLDLMNCCFLGVTSACVWSSSNKIKKHINKRDWRRTKPCFCLSGIDCKLVRTTGCHRISTTSKAATMDEGGDELVVPRRVAYCKRRKPCPNWSTCTDPQNPKIRNPRSSTDWGQMRDQGEVPFGMR